MNEFSAPIIPEEFNMVDYFVHANIRAGRGEKAAILFGDKAISYAEVADRVDRTARRLVGEGLLPEQRVLIAMTDCPEAVYAFFGAIKAGAVVAHINPLLPEADYRYYLDYVRPQFAFIDETSLAAFSAAGAETRHCCAGRNIIADLEGWLAVNAEAEPWPTRADDPALWLFTSGTTGKAKAAVHTHAHYVYNSEIYAKHFIGIRENDVTLSGPRLFFGYATGTNLLFPFAVGATTILCSEPPTVERLLALIGRHRPTIFTSVPTLINKILAVDDGTADLSSLRFMWSAGEALPLELHARWDARFRVPIIDGIGSSENFHIYISNHLEDIKPGSLGKLIPSYEARLVDDDGTDVEIGQIGTLWLKSPTAALYYHAAYEKSREHLRAGWIVTGDKFRQDDEGYWYYEGRGDDLIKSGGIYVSPLEVENCLTAHPAVRECCVIGRADSAGLEKPLAIVVASEPVSASELIDFAKERLARYKAPHSIVFRDVPLPRNDRDKIDRKVVRQEYA